MTPNGRKPRRVTRPRWHWLAGMLALCALAASCSPSPPVVTETATLPVVETSPPTVELVGTSSPSPAPATIIATPVPSPTPSPTPALPPLPLQGIEIHEFSADPQLAATAGARFVRINGIDWSLVEAVQGTYDWSALAKLESGLATVASLGLEPIVIVHRAPTWAQQIPGVACGPIAAEDYAAFGAFLAALAERYGGEPYHVKYWELGNEPDVAANSLPPNSPYGCWGDPAQPYFGGAAYGEMLKAAVPVLRQADPAALILTGGLLLDCNPLDPPETAAGSGEFKDCSPATFLEGVLQAGGGAYFDIVSFHAYDYYFRELGKYGNGNWKSGYRTSGPALAAKVVYLRQLLAQHGAAEKLLFNTESALLCGSTGKEPECLTEEFATTKAAYVAISYAMARQSGLGANLWYSLRGWRASGLVDAQLQPLAAYQAYAFQGELLAELTPSGIVELTSGVVAYQFAGADRQVWLVVSQDGAEHLLELEKMPAAMYASTGESLPPSQDLTIGLLPAYLIWEE